MLNSLVLGDMQHVPLLVDFCRGLIMLRCSVAGVLCRDISA